MHHTDAAISIVLNTHILSRAWTNRPPGYLHMSGLLSQGHCAVFMSPSTMLSPLLAGATFSPTPGGGFSPSPTTPGYSPASPGALTPTLLPFNQVFCMRLSCDVVFAPCSTALLGRVISFWVGCSLSVCIRIA